MDKIALVKAAFNNEKTERVPCGFWHHFILGADQFQGLERPDLLERAYAGHVAYYRTVQPDIMKLMNEGFFGYPPIMDNPFQTEADLRQVRAIGPDHPWITAQVRHVRRLVDAFKDEVLCFYNVFAPLQMIRIRFEFLDMDFSHFVSLAERFPAALRDAGLEIQKDIRTLVRKLFEETDLAGIYYCVQNVQSDRYDRAMYDRYIRPTELPLLAYANTLSPYNILHICGYAHHTNAMDYYRDYKAGAYNWAVHTEHIPLETGKRFFDGACVLGGFDNNPASLIQCGTPAELTAETARILAENDYPGLILGADCSVPNDIDDRNLRIIRDACAAVRRTDRTAQQR